MPANYNNSAWFYERLSRLVYGNALMDAQVYLLQFIPANSTVLIVGGGTGQILEEIAKKCQPVLKITYVEVAEKMIALSKKRNIGQNEVVFVNDAIEQVSNASGFDVVITPFLFDNFTEQTLQKVFGHIHSMLEPAGLWLNADFQLSGKWWQNVLLKTMFLFFRVICNIEASKLPQIEKQFVQFKYTAVQHKTFFGGFIVSNIYTKLRDAKHLVSTNE